MSNIQCPHCSNDDQTMIDVLFEFVTSIVYFCGVCSKKFEVKKK